MNGSLERLRAWVKAHPARVAAAGCVAIAVFCIVYIVTHTPPWQLDRMWERHAKLKPTKLDDYIAYGLWLGAAAGVAISLVLAATAFLWARPATAHTAELRVDKMGPGRRFWIAVGIIVLLAAAIRAPRMAQSLWGDESWAYSDLIGGRYSQNNDGSLDYQPHDWKTTLFWDKGLNNQYLFTITARLSNRAWQKINGKPAHAFSETALRLPALIAGLLSIAAFAGLLRRLGYSHAGLALAALLCINPWHIRYSGEARSYTMLILFLALMTWCLVNALASDRRRWWALFALAEFAALYSWKAAIHPCAAINLAALTILFFRLRRDAVVPAARCIAANGFALLAFVPLFGPGMPQIALNLARGHLVNDGSMGIDWYARVWSQILGAMDWSGGSADSPFQTIFLPQIIALETTALSDPRGADQLTRSAEQGYGNLEASDHITVGVYRRVVSYDPRKIQKFEGEHIRDTATLAKVLRHADANGKTVDVTAANLGFIQAEHPEFYQLLSDERYFKPLGILPAAEPYIRIAIWRYRPGSFPAEP